MGAPKPCSRVSRSPRQGTLVVVIARNPEHTETSASPTTALAAARRGDRSAQAAVGEVLDHLADGLAAVIALIDPELVVVGGGIGRQLGPHLAAVQSRVGELVPLTQPRFAISRLGDDATLFGGLASGLTTARELVLLPSWTARRG